MFASCTQIKAKEREREWERVKTRAYLKEVIKAKK